MVGDVVAFGGYLEIYYFAFQLRRFDVAESLESEGVIENEEILFIGDKEVPAGAVAKPHRVIIGLHRHYFIDACGEKTH